MKAKRIANVIPVYCLLVSFPAFAQQMVMPPPAIQAIDTHLQQSRTQKQHEALGEERAASSPPRQTTQSKPSSQKTTAKVKPKAVSQPPKKAAAAFPPESQGKPILPTTN